MTMAKYQDPIELEYEDSVSMPTERQERVDNQMRRVQEYYKKRGLPTLHVANNNYYKMLAFARKIKACDEGAKCNKNLNTIVEEDEYTSLDMKKMQASIDDIKHQMYKYSNHQHPRESYGDRPPTMSASSHTSQDDSRQDVKIVRILGVNYFPDYEVRRPGMRPKASVEKEKDDSPQNYKMLGVTYECT